MSFCTDAGAKLSSSNVGQEHPKTQGVSNKIQEHDVAIVGGGMVGLALACSLGKHAVDEAFESTRITEWTPRQERGPSLIQGSVQLHLQPCHSSKIGAWKYVEQHRHAYFDKMQVWDYTGLGYTKYNARDVDKEFLGCVVENKVLQSSLLSCIQERTDFQKTIYPSRLTTLHRNSSSVGVGSTSSALPTHEWKNPVKLDLTDGSSLRAKLVVGADGAKSNVRELAGFTTTGWNYSQNAVICTVEHDIENQCAWQRFLPSGPIALLPIGDNYSNIVWTMNPKEAADRKEMPESEFLKDVNYALDYGFGPHPSSTRFGNGGIFSWLKPDVTSSVTESFEVPPKVMKLASGRMVFPLSLRHANNYASKNVVLIGDAAHTVHPLAGQGVNMGFGDALALSKVIAEGVAVGTDIGEVSLLKKFEGERKLENIAMMGILDGIQKAYSVDFGPLNVLRAAAFSWSKLYFSS
ncbi:hypothetical protein F8388_018005 [Cannabis sativa]|uniref:Ubiquinone biosynthesis monooxygenase COQ6, mitochondrial n=1 Tax=Cannabis sativa TaxID=3483 RepID=A0A7J6E917_CANSA|nr:hypothetical protein F8388_018005 [Cannabis sativa]